jgi:hypothetical protein
MPKKDTIHPWQQIEEQAFHAFREWPIWLLLRERELAARSTQSPSDQVHPPTTRPAVEQSTRN